MVVLTVFLPPGIIEITCDSGGVTTSTITVLLVTVFGVGLAAAICSGNPIIDGFGLISFANLTLMIFVSSSGWWCDGFPHAHRLDQF